MTQRNYDDWLAAFVEYASIGEAPLHVLYWVGVSTIAGALRRKVWIDQVFFRWVPNFYVVAVAEPGIIAKSTTANIGFDLLADVQNVEGSGVGTINFGPDIATWEVLIQEMGKIGEMVDIGNGVRVPMSAITCAIDELGTFLDPTNREQVDALTRLWDGKISKRAFRKATKTQGTDVIEAPWINVFACTTPTWVNSNFPEYFLGSGLFSRMIFVHAEGKRQLVALPSKHRPKSFTITQQKLITDLTAIAALSGEFKPNKSWEDWMEKWYTEHWTEGRHTARELQGYPARKQTHLAKLSMIIAAARGDFPTLGGEHLEEAHRQLQIVEPGMAKVYRSVGSSGLPKTSQEIIDVLTKTGPMTRREVFREHFFRKMSNQDFLDAVASLEAAGIVKTMQSPSGPILTLAGA